MDFKVIDYTKVDHELHSGNWKLRSDKKEEWKDAYSVLKNENGIKINFERYAVTFGKEVTAFGAYKLKVEIAADDNGVDSYSIYQGRRNLVTLNQSLLPNETRILEFYTFVTPYIPALTYKKDYDKTAYVSFIGKNLIIKNISIETADVNTIFIAGDSTLTDQNALTPYYPICSCGGWAQDLSMFVEKYAVCNYAHSGLTTNCFRDDGHLDILNEQFKKGDVFIIQFGHNDQKRRNLLPYKQYKENLIWYCNKIISMEGLPIICSPISRVPIADESGAYSLLADYAKACKEASEELNIPFIDLHSFTFDKWISFSADEVKNYFIPGDVTHTNDYGAALIAKYVATEFEKIESFKDNVSLKDVSFFYPDYDTKDFPKELNLSSPFDIKPPFMDMDEVTDVNLFSDAFKKGLLDPCVMHAHPKAYLERAQLLMILLRALRLSGTRPYVGEFKDILRNEWDSSFVQTCINENLIDDTTVTKTEFRPNDYLTYGEFASFCIRGLLEKEERNISMKECFNKACTLKIISNKETNSFITREEIYIGLARIIDLKNNSSMELPTDTEMHPVH